MRQKDLLTVAVIVIIAAATSFIISGKVFDSPKNRQLKVQVVDEIKSTFPEINEKGELVSMTDYFNDKSINPTRIIEIGKDSNSKPFNNKQ